MYIYIYIYISVLSGSFWLSISTVPATPRLRQAGSKLAFRLGLGALLTRKGFWGILYYNYNKDPPPPPQKKAPIRARAPWVSSKVHSLRCVLWIPVTSTSRDVECILASSSFNAVILKAVRIPSTCRRNCRQYYMALVDGIALCGTGRWDRRLNTSKRSLSAMLYAFLVLDGPFFGVGVPRRGLDDRTHAVFNTPNPRLCCLGHLNKVMVPLPPQEAKTSRFCGRKCAPQSVLFVTCAVSRAVAGNCVFCKSWRIQSAHTI